MFSLLLVCQIKHTLPVAFVCIINTDLKDMNRGNSDVHITHCLHPRHPPTRGLRQSQGQKFNYLLTG